MLHQITLVMTTGLLGGILVLLFACGGGNSVMGEDCLVSRNGVLVGSPCESPGIAPDPTATPPIMASGSTSAGGNEGAQLFLRSGCAACHTIDNSSATGQVGPNLTVVGGKSEAYIRESIITTNAVIAEECPGAPCQPDIMPQNFAEVLSEAEIDGLVSYLSLPN
jgi:mono/diheme cytochrome c family protein